MNLALMTLVGASAFALYQGAKKQYIFSHNKIIVKTLADYFDVQLLSGLELTNALYNQLLQNSFCKIAFLLKINNSNKALKSIKTH